MTGRRGRRGELAQWPRMLTRCGNSMRILLYWSDLFFLKHVVEVSACVHTCVCASACACMRACVPERVCYSEL